MNRVVCVKMMIIQNENMRFNSTPLKLQCGALMEIVEGAFVRVRREILREN